ncbi:acyl-CoA dehydrogenase family protein [Lichenicoccus sp.]|uniref:acyl-CoA dehydrogenase family protein n=1 Tax=Lichenicoccus sp. TaxID=2781899 RepID=UPI003D136D1A
MNALSEHIVVDDAELEMVRATARRFFTEEIAPHYAAWEKQGHGDRAIWRKAGALGLLCPMLKEENGGVGGDIRHSQVIIEEMARSHCELPGLYLHSDIVVPYIERLGTLQQKRRWLPRCMSGDIVTCIGISEPDAGSDMRGLRTRAVRDGDEWVLNGSKTFITNGWLADLALVVANTGASANTGSKSIFLVETDRPGFRRGRLLEKVGQKAQDTTELFLDDVRVPVEALLGEEGKGMAYLMQELPIERLIIAISALALTEAVFAETLKYVRERRAFGQLVADFQVTRFTLAELKTDIEVGRAFVDDCVGKILLGTLDTSRASMAKLWLTEMQGRVVDRCVQLFGGYGYMWDYPVARAFANARGQRIYGGSSDIMKEIIARDIAKSP